MVWILLDVLVGLLAVVALALGALTVWRQAKALGREFARAGDQLSAMIAVLDAAEPPGRQPEVVARPAGVRARSAWRTPGVRSGRSAQRT